MIHKQLVGGINVSVGLVRSAMGLACGVGALGAIWCLRSPFCPAVVSDTVVILVILGAAAKGYVASMER